MATPQPPPPPQQPIYQRDLSLILDRVHTKFVEYARSNDEVIAAQMWVGYAESQARDDALLRRVEALETNQKFIIDTLLKIQQDISESRQEMRAGFAALDEKINELTRRVVHLEGGLPPTTPEQ